MIGHRVYPLHLQYSLREYECSVTFLKVSDISVTLQSRSFPSAGSPPGSQELPKRFLKLTTLYGTGQQEIGEFQISGSECDIKQRRSYKFVSTDSVSVTKLHVYVDEVFNSGLTGHVTIDLKEFIGEDDSEIYLEYPLSASNLRHRAAKLQVVVQCRGPTEDENEDCLDMDLETFLYDEFPERNLTLNTRGRLAEDLVAVNYASRRSKPGYEIQPTTGVFLESSALEPEVEYLQHPAGSVGENNLAALDQQQGCGPLSHGGLHGLQPKFRENNQEALGQQEGSGAQSQVPSLKDFEGDFLGLDSILKDFVAEYSQTRPFLVTGHREKPKDRKHPTQTDLHNAVFFAAGVTMQQRLQSLETNNQSTLLTTQESADRGISPTTCSSRVLLRSQSDEFDVKRILSSPERPLPEVVTVSKEAAFSGLKLNEGPFYAPCSPSSGNNEIESAKGSTDEAEWKRRGYLVACPTCSTGESRIKDTLPVHGNFYTAACDGSTAMTSAEETQSLIPVSTSKPKRSAVVVVRNILGILFIAGVSFVLGAYAGCLGTACETSTDSPGNSSEIQQMGTCKETLISQMVGLQRGRSPQDHSTSSSPRMVNKFGLPRPMQQGHRKIAWSSPAPSPAGTHTVELFQDDRKPEELREMDWKGAYLNNLPDGYHSERELVARIEQQGVIGVADSLHRSRNDIEKRVEHLQMKILKGSRYS